MGFFDYFKAGFQDFIFLNIFGHILFIVVLTGIYTLPSWRIVFSFVGFFITGYLISFLMTWYGLVDIPMSLLKILIPITVVATAFTNFFVKKQVFTNRYPSQNFRYYFALVAGLIHGFSFVKPGLNTFHMLAYNSGVISCILFSSLVFLFCSFVLTYFLRVSLREWNLIVSGACAGIALFKLFLNLL